MPDSDTIGVAKGISPETGAITLANKEQQEQQELQVPGQKQLDVQDATSSDDEGKEFAPKLPGTLHMVRLRLCMTTLDYWLLFSGMFLAAYAANLDYCTRSTFVSYAAAGYSEHSLLSTINVVRGVIAAAVQPIAAKLADLIGRLEVFVVATFFYVLGTIIQAGGQTLTTLAVGALLQQIGYTVATLIMEIVIADIVSLRSRTIFLFLPNTPYIINAWIGGNITDSLMSSGDDKWRWGVGMYALIYPVAMSPFAGMLWYLGRRGEQRNAAQGGPPRMSYISGYSSVGEFALDLFWKLDILGLFVMVASLSMLLIPMTLAGGQSSEWKTAGILVPVILGFLLAFVFVYIESRVPYPVMPFDMMRERSVWAGLGIATFTAFVWATQGDYLYTVLLVGYDFSIAAATRISSVYSFCEIISGFVVGALIYFVRRVKYLALVGVAGYFIGLGIMLHYRGGEDSSSKIGVVAGQVLVGFAGSWFSFPNAIAAQAMTKHEDIAVLTSLWLTCNYIGMAFGECVSGAIWTQTLYDQLVEDLAPVNSTLAVSVYESPLYVVPNYPVGTPERTEIIHSYKYIQRLLLISSLCLTVPILMFTMCLRNTKLKGHFYNGKK